MTLTTAAALAAALEHHRAGQWCEAERLYRQVVALDASHALAWHCLGLVLHQMGNSAQGAEHITRALVLAPDDAEAHNNLGLILSSLDRHTEAIGHLRRAIALRPDLAEAHYNLGLALKDLGQLDESIACFRQALLLKPDYAEAFNHLGHALHVQGQATAAAECFRRAIQHRPDYAEAHNHLGNILGDLGKFAEAIASYRQALDLSPDYAEALTNLGTVLADQWQLAEAIACHQRALELQPELAEACNNLGAALQKQHRDEEALGWYRRFLELRPHVAEGHVNLGNAYKHLRRFDEALRCYERALELKPAYAWAHVNRATMRLLAGDFDRGWPEYEWRWQTGRLVPHKCSQPRWEGQDLAGKTILLCAEQGLGDTLQFIRYAAVVKSLGATVVAQCPPRLRNLLASCPAIDYLISEGGALPAFDFYAPLLSLPAILKTTLDTIPQHVPYLFADPSLVALWGDRLRDLPGLRIGINWHGRGGHGTFRHRDIPLACFASLAQLPRVRLVSLQHETSPDERTTMRDRVPIVEPGGEIDGERGAFVDTAAILQNLNLVITSDTSLPHLAGALGVPVWLALPAVPDWRWLLDRTDSPWYPTMRIFRQRTPGDWSDVFDEMRSALEGRAGGTSDSRFEGKQ